MRSVWLVGVRIACGWCFCVVVVVWCVCLCSSPGWLMCGFSVICVCSRVISLFLFDWAVCFNKRVF